MAKKPKEIDVPVRVSLDTSQIVDMSAAVEDFVNELALSVDVFIDNLRGDLDELNRTIQDFAGFVQGDSQRFRAALPGLPTYTVDVDDDLDDEVVCAPACPAGAAGCPCREAI